MSSFFHIVKRDIILRINSARRIFFYNILILFFISISSIFIDEGNHLFGILLKKIFGGFSYQELNDYTLKRGIVLPYYWLLFQTLFVLSLGTYFLDDLINNSELVIIRIGKQKFIYSKILSLLIYCIIYVLFILWGCLLILLIMNTLGYHDVYSLSHHFISISRLFIFIFFLIPTLFIEALIFELLSIMTNQIIGFIIIMVLMFLSMFSRNILLIGSYTMLFRWTESNMLMSNFLVIIVWILINIIFLSLVIKIISQKIDLISQKGIDG